MKENDITLRKTSMKMVDITGRSNLIIRIKTNEHASSFDPYREFLNTLDYRNESRREKSAS